MHFNLIKLGFIKVSEVSRILSIDYLKILNSLNIKTFDEILLFLSRYV